MTKRFTKTYTHIPPLKDDNNEVKFFTLEEKANRFAEKLAETMTPHKDELPDFTRETDEKVNAFLSQEPTKVNEPVSVDQVRKQIRRFKNGKAPGPDAISKLVLKKLPTVALESLCNIYNACLRLCYFPKDWKTAKVLVLAKPGKDLSLAFSYRTISL